MTVDRAQNDILIVRTKLQQLVVDAVLVKNENNNLNIDQLAM